MIFKILDLGIIGIRENHRKLKSNKTALLIFLLALIGCVGVNTYLRGGLEFRWPENIKSLLKSANLNYTIAPNLNTNCTDKFSQFKEFHSCLISDDRLPQILILGDSHGQQYYYSLKNSYPTISVMNLSEYGCLPFVDDTTLNSSIVGCKDKIPMVSGFINETNSIKVIIFAGRWTSLANVEWQGTKDDQVEKNIESFFINANDFIKTIKRNDVELHLLLDNPLIPFDFNSCLRLKNGDINIINNLCSFPDNWPHKNYELIDKGFVKLQNENPNIKFHRSSAALCPNQVCLTQINGSRLYFDNNHLTLKGADMVIEFLKTNQNLGQRLR